jgi:hypothetical protein
VRHRSTKSGQAPGRFASDQFAERGVDEGSFLLNSSQAAGFSQEIVIQVQGCTCD